MEWLLIYLSRITTPHQVRLLSSSSVHEDCITLDGHLRSCSKLLTTRGRSWGARSESWTPRTWPYLAQAPTVIHAAGYTECPSSYSATRMYAWSIMSDTIPLASKEDMNRLAAAYIGLYIISGSSWGRGAINFIQRKRRARSGPASHIGLSIFLVRRFLDIIGIQVCTVSK